MIPPLAILKNHPLGSQIRNFTLHAVVYSNDWQGHVCQAISAEHVLNNRFSENISAFADYWGAGDRELPFTQVNYFREPPADLKFWLRLRPSGLHVAEKPFIAPDADVFVRSRVEAQRIVRGFHLRHAIRTKTLDQVRPYDRYDVTAQDDDHIQDVLNALGVQYIAVSA